MPLNRVPEKLIGDGLGLATQEELDTHNTAKTGVHGVGNSYLAKTSRADQQNQRQVTLIAI